MRMRRMRCGGLGLWGGIVEAVALVAVAVAVGAVVAVRPGAGRRKVRGCCPSGTLETRVVPGVVVDLNIIQQIFSRKTVCTKEIESMYLVDWECSIFEDLVRVGRLEADSHLGDHHTAVVEDLVQVGRLEVDSHLGHHHTAAAAMDGRIHKLAVVGGTSMTLTDSHSLCGL